MRILVIDTETTGISPLIDEFVSVALLPGTWDIETASVEFHTLEAFYRHPAEQVLWGTWPEIHIKPNYTKDAEPLEWDVLQYMLGEAELIIGFNVKFDVDVLHRTAQRLSISLPVRPMRCVQRDLLPDVDYGKLFEVHAHFTNSAPRDWHTAGGDTYATADIFKARLKEAAEVISEAVFNIIATPRTPEQKAIAFKLGFRWDWGLRCHRRNYTSAQLNAGIKHRKILEEEGIKYTVRSTEFNERRL